MAKGGVKFTKAQRAEIVEKYLAGYKLELLAVQYGCDVSYPTVLAKRAGHAADRPRGPQRKRKAAA